MPSIKRLDTFIFIFLLAFYGGAVLLGYKTFPLPEPYYYNMGCGEKCEALRHTRQELKKGIVKLGKRTPHNPTPQTDIWKSLADSRKSFRHILSPMDSSTSGSLFPSMPNWRITAFYRALFLNPLYLLSVLLGMPFHLFLSILCVGLLGANALLLEKITINGHRQTYGRGFFLGAQLPFVMFAHGRTVLTTFGAIMLLYAISSRKTRSYWLMACFGLPCALISRSTFATLWCMLLVHCILHWRALLVTHRRAIIMTILIFCPFVIYSALNDFLSQTSVVRGHIKHGSLFVWDADKQILQNSLLIPLYIIALAPWVPKLSKSLWLDFDFHALCVMLSLAGMFLSATPSRILLPLNCLLLKICLERYFLKDQDSHVPEVLGIGAQRPAHGCLDENRVGGGN